MVEIINMKDDIMDWLLYINLFSIVLGFFMFSKALFIFVLSVNIILNGTFIVMSKMGGKFTKQHDKMYGGENGTVQG